MIKRKKSDQLGVIWVSREKKKVENRRQITGGFLFQGKKFVNELLLRDGPFMKSQFKCIFE